MQTKVTQRVFVLVSLGVLFLVRLPSIVFDYEINPDESQMITQALTLWHDPVYFRSVDGTTAGPLDSYFLVIPHLFGLPFDYITAHLTAFGLVAICLWLLFRTARLWFGEQAARLALLPFIFTLGLTQNGDLLHYNSELIALVLLNWSCYLYATLLTKKQLALVRIGLIALLLGMIPFAKLQAVPMAAVVGLFVMIDIAMDHDLTRLAKIRCMAVLCMSALFFSALVILLTKVNGVYEDFVRFYIVGNYRYATNTNQWQNLMRLPDFFQRGGEFDWLIKFIAIIWFIGLLAAFPSEK